MFSDDACALPGLAQAGQPPTHWQQSETNPFVASFQRTFLSSIIGMLMPIQLDTSHAALPTGPPKQTQRTRGHTSVLESPPSALPSVSLVASPAALANCVCAPV